MEQKTQNNNVPVPERVMNKCKTCGDIFILDRAVPNFECELCFVIRVTDVLASQVALDDRVLTVALDKIFGKEKPNANHK